MIFNDSFAAECFDVFQSAIKTGVSKLSVSLRVDPAHIVVLCPKYFSDAVIQHTRKEKISSAKITPSMNYDFVYLGTRVLPHYKNEIVVYDVNTLTTGKQSFYIQSLGLIDISPTGEVEIFLC